MRFDSYTVVLLLTGDNPPLLSDAEASAIQDAHLNHLATLHEQGYLVAAGPLMDEPNNRVYRGLSILNVPPDKALELKSADPAVQAGVFKLKVLPWMLPSGAITFTPTTFPHSSAEAMGSA